jgi:hypothetical protein
MKTPLAEEARADHPFAFGLAEPALNGAR